MIHLIQRERLSLSMTVNQCNFCVNRKRTFNTSHVDWIQILSITTGHQEWHSLCTNSEDWYVCVLSNLAKDIETPRSGFIHR